MSRRRTVLHSSQVAEKYLLFSFSHKVSRHLVWHIRFSKPQSPRVLPSSTQRTVRPGSEQRRALSRCSSRSNRRGLKENKVVGNCRRWPRVSCQLPASAPVAAPQLWRSASSVGVEVAPMRTRRDTPEFEGDEKVASDRCNPRGSSPIQCNHSSPRSQTDALGRGRWTETSPIARRPQQWKGETEQQAELLLGLIRDISSARARSGRRRRGRG